MRPSDAEITRHHHDNRPDSDAWVEGYVQTPFRDRRAEYDERWPADFDRVATAIRDAIGDRALELHHVGSTSVEGLPAKPVIDVDLVVADPADEPSYVPALVAAGFVHVIREPWWHEHRAAEGRRPGRPRARLRPRLPRGGPAPDVPDWLREHPDDLARYADAKRAAAAEMNARPGGGTGMDYNRHKEPVVLAIYERMFRAHGMLP